MKLFKALLPEIKKQLPILRIAVLVSIVSYLLITSKVKNKISAFSKLLALVLMFKFLKKRGGS